MNSKSIALVSLFAALAIALNIILFMKSRKLENQVENLSIKKKKEVTSQDPLKTLKTRFVKDEITEEEYIKKKKLLEEH